VSERGRPVRYPVCPECGQNSEGLRLYGVRKAGNIVNAYCECPACGIRLRYVISGHQGFWVRVRDVRDFNEKNRPENTSSGCL